MGNILGNRLVKLPSKLDLLNAAVSEYDFLRLIDNHPALYCTPVLLNAVYRYETYWLPLAAQYEGEYLPAPLDIEWVWHCHILNPVAYSNDCNSMLGKVVDHRPMVLNESASQKSKNYWNQKYNGVPYDIDLYDTTPTPLISGTFIQKSSYDIVAACQRQRGFNYNSSLPHFRDLTFLKKAVQRYKVLLMIKRDNPHVFVVPCYDNDLIWHTHQQFPHYYWSDTSFILGKVLDHDDSPEDRSPGSPLNQSCQTTRSLWKNMGRKFGVPGAMYRGEPPMPKVDNVENRFGVLANKVYIFEFIFYHRIFGKIKCNYPDYLFQSTF